MDKIFEILSQYGDCYLVGGAVRDLLLGREPNDYDFATNLEPHEVLDIFENLGYMVAPTGIKYGTVSVVVDDEVYEITTYRKDIEYKDGRRPEVIEYADTLEEDLARRDFTINAMAMNRDGAIFDYNGGLDDLKDGVIRCVGNPMTRFREDKLRILRAFRFGAQLNFKLHYEIITSIIGGNDISNLSVERITTEFNKILITDKPSDIIRTLNSLELLSQILPEIIPCIGFNQNNIHHDKTVYEHTLSVIDTVKPDLRLRLSALFHDIGKPATYTVDEDGNGHFYGHSKESTRICREAMTRLRYSKSDIEYVSELVYHHMTRYYKVRDASTKKFMVKVGLDKLDDLFDLFVADRTSSKPPYDLDDIYELKFECYKILNEKQPLTRKDLAINGNDLIALGFKGTQIGEVLQYVLDAVIENPEINDNNALLTTIKNQPYINGRYNPSYGDSVKCECGHIYYRHFDSWEDMYPVGCKYCGCYIFKKDLK